MNAYQARRQAEARQCGALGAHAPVDLSARSLDFWPRSARELYEERAAIRQFDGGQTRAQAEAGARADVVRYYSKGGTP